MAMASKEQFLFTCNGSSSQITQPHSQKDTIQARGQTTQRGLRHASHCACSTQSHRYHVPGLAWRLDCLLHLLARTPSWRFAKCICPPRHYTCWIHGLSDNSIKIPEVVPPVMGYGAALLKFGGSIHRVVLFQVIWARVLSFQGLNCMRLQVPRRF